jgi:YHS domain-containing protein
MVGWVIRLLLVIFVLRAVLRLWRGVVDGMRPAHDAHPAAVALVRDPVCGTFVVPSRALTAGSGPRLQFFCSEDCRRAYEAKPAP